MFKKVSFFSLFCAVLIMFCSQIYGANLNSSSVNFEKLASELMQEGVGKNLGNNLLDKGYFGEKAFSLDMQQFYTTFLKNNTFHWYQGYAGNKNLYKHDDPVIQDLQNMYISLVNEMEKTESMKFLFQQAGKYAGILDEEYSVSCIERVASTIMEKKIQEVVSAYKRGCPDNSASGKFTYNGKQYSCKELTGAMMNVNYEPTYAYEFLSNCTRHVSKEVDETLEANGTLVSDTFVKELNEKVNKIQYPEEDEKDEDKNKDENTDGTVKDDDIDEAFDDEYDFGDYKIKFNEVVLGKYYPNLINSIKFSEELKDKGELKSEEGTISQGVINIIDEFVSEFSFVGIIIMFSAILFLGIRMIWDKLNGMTLFKQSLPYLVLGILFFWCAPRIVDVIQQNINTADVQNSINNLWGSVLYIVRILTFAGIIFTGIKIMFSNAEGKANIKNKLVSILIGCILIFASSLIVQIIVNTFNESVPEYGTDDSNLNDYEVKNEENI